MAKPKDDLAAYRKRLKDSRDELLRMIENTAESRAPVQLDQTRQGRLSRMDAIQQQAMATETDRRRHQELTRIDGEDRCTAAGASRVAPLRRALSSVMWLALHW